MEELARHALTLNDMLPGAHGLLSPVYLMKRQPEAALAAAEQAVALDPNFAEVYIWRAQSLMAVDRPAEAVRAIEQALRLTPQPSKLCFLPLGQAYYLLGRTEEAIEPLRRVLSMYPHLMTAHVLLAAAYSEVGREQEARTEAAEVLRLNTKFSLEVHKERMPIKDPAVLERHLAALRKAGLK
jgi:adenylate cyclase